MDNAIQQNGVMIARTPKGIAVAWAVAPPPVVDRPICVEIEQPTSGGKFVKRHYLSPITEFPFRDYYGDKVNHLALVIRVKDGDKLLAQLGESDLLPFMTIQGEQQHITENYVSVPPALTITDEVGAVWTLGFATAPPELSPHGEFAFDVLRDGVDIGEIASRIERRHGAVRIFTRHGWKRWTGQSFF